MSAFRDVVVRHHADSDAFLVASREPCITIVYDEQANVAGRSFRVLAPEALGNLDPRASWFMAVLLCPGDDARAVAEWVRTGGHDPRRIVFYFHPGTDARAALAPWIGAGLSVHATWTAKTWQELHKHFGAAWNVRVFDDFRTR